MSGRARSGGARRRLDVERVAKRLRAADVGDVGDGAGAGAGVVHRIKDGDAALARQLERLRRPASKRRTAFRPLESPPDDRESVRLGAATGSVADVDVRLAARSTG